DGDEGHALLVAAAEESVHVVVPSRAAVRFRRLTLASRARGVAWRRAGLSERAISTHWMPVTSALVALAGVKTPELVRRLSTVNALLLPTLRVIVQAGGDAVPGSVQAQGR